MVQTRRVQGLRKVEVPEAKITHAKCRKSFKFFVYPIHLFASLLLSDFVAAKNTVAVLTFTYCRPSHAEASKPSELEKPSSTWSFSDLQKQVSHGVEKTTEGTLWAANKTTEGTLWAANKTSEQLFVIVAAITKWSSEQKQGLSKSLSDHLISKGFRVEKNHTLIYNKSCTSVAIPFWLPKGGSKKKKDDYTCENELYCAVVGLGEIGKDKPLTIDMEIFSKGVGSEEKNFFKGNIPINAKVGVPGLSINFPGFEDYGSVGLLVEVEVCSDNDSNVTLNIAFHIGLAAYGFGKSGVEIYRFQVDLHRPGPKL